MENIAIEPPAFKVPIIYNGTPKDEEVHKTELVGNVLQRALQLFQVRDRQHVYGLFKARRASRRTSRTSAGSRSARRRGRRRAPRPRGDRDGGFPTA